MQSASYDKVVAVETCLTTRDITVAEGRFGCLQVTKVNGANIPLREQDWSVCFDFVLSFSGNKVFFIYHMNRSREDITIYRGY